MTMSWIWWGAISVEQKSFGWLEHPEAYRNSTTTRPRMDPSRIRSKTRLLSSSLHGGRSPSREDLGTICR